MLPLTIIKILLFALVPLGIFLLVKGIPLLRKAFNGALIIEVPFTQKNATFQIAASGLYEIWQKGKIFRKTPADQFRPVVINKKDCREVSLSRSLLGTQSNNGSVGSMKLFSFQAEAGGYELNLADGSSRSRIESVIAGSIADVAGIGELAPAEYFIQIRKGQPGVKTVLGLLFTLAGSIMIIGGFVRGVLADQMFT